MTPQVLLQHFDRIGEAPDAIPRLRRFILDLAVRGKLVEQDHRDEPASELLKRIQAEKMALIKKGAIKGKSEPVTIVGERPDFVMPSGWVLTTLGEVAHKITDGAHKTPTYVEKGVPFISVKDFSSGRLIFSNTRFISPEEHATLYKRCDPRCGDILIGRIGTLGKAVLVDTDNEFSLFVSVGLIRFSHDFIAPVFFRLLLNSPFVESEFDRIKIGGGTHTNKLNLGDLHTIVLPLPPLAEQHRIVAKVDELMGLCDRLEAAQTERESRRDRLVASSLHHLNNGADADAFREHARFYFNHLPRLTTRPDHIKQLRQTILNLAVRGKLVPQDPSEEPASQLLKRIQEEKVSLIKDGKIKKGKTLQNISELEKPFALPSGWEWARMQEVFDVRDGTHDTPKYILGEGVPLITSRNFIDGKISFDEAKLISWNDHESIKKRSGVERGDILYSMIGGNIGNQVLVDTDREFSIKNVALFKYYTKNGSLPGYLNLFLKTLTIGLQNEAAGGAQPFVSLTLLRNIPIPIPPLAEQHRIVAKVDELMALCDHLETQLTTTHSESQKLMEAILHEALLAEQLPQDLPPIGD